MTLILASFVGMVWFMFDAQLKHLDLHHSEGFLTQHKLGIKELEETVRKNPKNFSAWKLLGEKYREDKDFNKAKESWVRALDVAHTEGEATWLKERLEHIARHHQ